MWGDNMFGTNYGYGNVNPNMGTAPYAGGFTAGVQALKGRQVASVDEVKAAQVDFSGNISYYPCPNQNVIYAKYLDMNTGSAVILEFRPQPVQQPQYAEMNAVRTLEQRIANIEQALGGMTYANATATDDAGK